MKKKLISIIIPTKNAAAFLPALLDSLVTQSYQSFEVIINDDIMTTDETKSLINKYQKSLSIIYINKNKSMAQARKAGAAIAKGEYQLHLDADMALEKDVLKECVEQAKTYDALIIPEVSIGRGYWAYVKAFERSLYRGDTTMESARFFKTIAYNNVKGHNEKLVFSEDKDLDIRIREKGYKVGRIASVIYHHEGKLSLFKDIRKKFFYGKTADLYLATHKKKAIQQSNVLLRPAYIRNWKKLVRNPLLSGGMFFMKFMELFAALLGLFVGKVERIRQ